MGENTLYVTVKTYKSVNSYNFVVFLEDFYEIIQIYLDSACQNTSESVFEIRFYSKLKLFNFYKLFIIMFIEKVLLKIKLCNFK